MIFGSGLAAFRRLFSFDVLAREAWWAWGMVFIGSRNAYIVRIDPSHFDLDLSTGSHPMNTLHDLLHQFFLPI